MPTIPFDIRNRWTGEVQLTAQIACDESALPSVRLGLAVRWARTNGADLRGADLRGAVLSGAVLSGADLRGADLSGADLSGAVLSGADLSGADLSGADLRDAVLSDAVLSDADLSGAVLSGAVLRSFKADLWLVLSSAQHEVHGLVSALREGRIDGSTYSGDCACLVGTIANVRGCPVSRLERDAGRPAERWFMMIKPGDRPGDDSGGGFAAKQALDWTLEFCRTFGIDPDGPAVASLDEEAA